MKVLVTHLNEYTARVRKHLLCDDQPIAKELK